MVQVHIGHVRTLLLYFEYQICLVEVRAPVTYILHSGCWDGDIGN